MFILVLPHVETIHCKRKRNKISKERKTEYSEHVLAEAKYQYAGKAMFSEQNKGWGGVGQYQKDWVWCIGWV